MHNKELDFPSTAQLRQRALSLWDNEGGSGPCGPKRASHRAKCSPVSISLATWPSASHRGHALPRTD